MEQATDTYTAIDSTIKNSSHVSFNTSHLSLSGEARHERTFQRCMVISLVFDHEVTGNGWQPDVVTFPIKLKEGCCGNGSE